MFTADARHLWTQLMKRNELAVALKPQRVSPRILRLEIPILNLRTTMSTPMIVRYACTHLCKMMSTYLRPIYSLLYKLWATHRASVINALTNKTPPSLLNYETAFWKDLLFFFLLPLLAFMLNSTSQAQNFVKIYSLIGDILLHRSLVKGHFISCYEFRVFFMDFHSLQIIFSAQTFQVAQNLCFLLQT